MVDAKPGPRLFSPGRMGRMALRNRIVMAPLLGGRAVVVEEGGREEPVGADLMILARGSIPAPTWLDLLRRKVPEVHAIGGLRRAAHDRRGAPRRRLGREPDLMTPAAGE